MLLTSLTALALTFTNICYANNDPSSVIPVSGFSSIVRETLDYHNGFVLDDDLYLSYDSGYGFFQTSLGDASFEGKFLLHYDDSYNEYFRYIAYFKFSENKISLYTFSSVFHDYNISLKWSFALYDDDDNVLSHYCSPTRFLVTQDCPLPSFGNAVTTNYVFTPNKDYRFDVVIYAEILDADFSDVFSDSYQDGYDDGKNTGYQQGYEQGKLDGFDDGASDGYQTGYDTGKTDGYTQGYNDALNTHSFSFTNLFASISDTPILMLRRLFGFELFGVELMSVFMSLFTALIVIIVIKRVFK